MFITIINDCKDDNAMARQTTRATCLFDQFVSFLGVTQSDMEAAGNLIDVLDASEGKKGIIMINVAPRHGKAKKWPNGTPFGFFNYKNTLVVSTIDGYCLSLAKKFGLIDKAYVTDIPKVIDHMIEKKEIDASLRNLIVNSQFRSYDYMPRLAKWLHDKKELPYEEHPLSEIRDIPHAIWWIDNFGNCKTTILAEDINFEPGKKIKTVVGEINCYSRLKDVPNDEPALIIGSSGFGPKRFLEFVIQGKSAAAKFNLKTGMNLFEE